MLDIFKNDAFSVAKLTDAVNNLSFQPGRIGELGIFTEENVDTPTIAVEKKGDILVLVPPTPRGGSGNTMDKEKRVLVPLIVPHFEINDSVYAAEVQGVRSFGTETQIETVMSKVAARQQTAKNSLTVTQEYSRIGAVSGIVTYADDSTLNLFTALGVTQEAEVDFDLDNATPVDGVLRRKCTAVVRTLTNNLGGVPFSGVWAFCGDDFFDDLLQHKEVRDTFKNWNEAQILRDGYIGPNKSTYGSFSFGGIVWENYRGNVGSKSFIDTNKCQIFPIGVPGLFKSAYAPADYIETVNTLGKQFYSKQYDMPNGKGVNLDTQMNALEYCARPKVLMKGKRT